MRTVLDNQTAAVFTLDVLGVVFEFAQRNLRQAHIAAAALIAIKPGHRGNAVLFNHVVLFQKVGINPFGLGLNLSALFLQLAHLLLVFGFVGYLLLVVFGLDLGVFDADFLFQAVAVGCVLLDALHFLLIVGEIGQKFLRVAAHVLGLLQIGGRGGFHALLQGGQLILHTGNSHLDHIHAIQHFGYFLLHPLDGILLLHQKFTVFFQLQAIGIALDLRLKSVGGHIGLLILP